MNYEQRKAITREMLARFYTRFTAPRGLDPQAQRDEVASVVEAVVRHMGQLPEDGYRERLGRALGLVADGATTRSWPTQGEVVKAVQAVNRDAAKAKTDDEPPEIYDMVRDWFLRFRDAMPSTARQHHGERMVAEGVATWEELRFGGFPITAAEKQRIEGGRKPVEEIMEGF